MLAPLETFVVLLAVVAGVAVLAQRMKVPSSILLVLAGVGLALAPGLPKVGLAPEFVLLIVLPPIIYDAAVAMSWREFRFNLRPIALLALGGVVFTTCAAAAAAHWILGLPWAVGFVLGAIIAPPDSVAPLSIARRLGLPRRIVVILEGEGLADDAAALVIYRFAVTAVATGAFSLGQAVGQFAAIFAGEIAWGLAVGWGMLRLRRWINEPSIEILLSLLTPFLAYWPPEQLGGSGVLATVTTGLYFSWNGPRLISAATRLQGVFFWRFLTYVIEGMVFLITGLQAHRLIGAATAYPTRELAVSAAVMILVVILARFLWTFPATYLPRWLVPAVRRRDPSPPWRTPFLLAFTGVRGIVSLTAALALPAMTASGAPLPDRDLILFLTFCVILFTLVGQGLMLPAVIGWLGLSDAGRQETRATVDEEFAARRRAIEAAARRLDGLRSEGRVSQVAAESIAARLADRLDRLERRRRVRDGMSDVIQFDDDVQLALVAEERRVINGLHRDGALKDEPRRRIEHDLDLREAHLANRAE